MTVFVHDNKRASNAISDHEGWLRCAGVFQYSYPGSRHAELYCLAIHYPQETDI